MSHFHYRKPRPDSGKPATLRTKSLPGITGCPSPLQNCDPRISLSPTRLTHSHQYQRKVIRASTLLCQCHQFIARLLQGARYRKHLFDLAVRYQPADAIGTEQQAIVGLQCQTEKSGAAGRSNPSMVIKGRLGCTAASEASFHPLTTARRPTNGLR